MRFGKGLITAVITFDLCILLNIIFNIKNGYS